MRGIVPALVALCCLAACEADGPTAGGRGLRHWKSEARQWSLMPWWSSSGDERRREAFGRLEEIGEPAVPVLVELLRERHHAASGDAFNALVHLGPRARSAVPDLVECLAEADPELRLQAAWILGAIGPDAARAVPVLSGLLDDPDPRLRDVAARSLAKVGEAGSEVLARAARSDDPRLRSGAIAGFAAAPGDVESIRSILTSSLEDPDEGIRAKALREVPLPRSRDDNEALVDLLVRAMNDSSPAVREAAHVRFTRTYQSQLDTTGFLVAILAGGDREARVHAAWNLGEVRSGWHGGSEVRHQDPAVLPALRRSLEDPDPAVRTYCAWGVWVRDPDSRSAVTRVFRTTLADEAADLELRVRAGQLLLRIDGKPGEVLPVFEKALFDENRFVRLDTLRSIKKLGGEAESVSPVLERLLEDRDREVRALAREALDAVLAPQEAARRSASAPRARAKLSSKDTTSAVQPVWWLAPTPRPESPWKYS